MIELIDLKTQIDPPGIIGTIVDMRFIDRESPLVESVFGGLTHSWDKRKSISFTADEKEIEQEYIAQKVGDAITEVLCADNLPD